MHMIINFMGSIVGLKVNEAITELYIQYELMLTGGEFNLLSLGANALYTFLYTNVQYGMIVGGAFALVHMIRNKKIHVSREKEISLPDREIVKSGVANVGSILFIAICSVLTILNLFIG